MTSLKFTIMLCCLAKIRSGRFVLLEKISTQRFSNCIHTDRESRKTAKQRLITSTVIYDTILPALQKPKKEPIYYNDPIKPQREPVHICICKFGKVLMTLVNCKWDFRCFRTFSSSYHDRFVTHVTWHVRVHGSCCVTKKSHTWLLITSSCQSRHVCINKKQHTVTIAIQWFFLQRLWS